MRNLSSFVAVTFLLISVKGFSEDSKAVNANPVTQPAEKIDKKSNDKSKSIADKNTAKAPAKTTTKKEKNKMVELKTSMGKIVIELDEKKAPISTKNFLRYVAEKHYNGTIFHRVIGSFMIQGGGMDAKMKEKSGHEPIKNEAANGLSNTRGTVAMARTNIVDSATAQFFINVADNKFLDHDESGGPAKFGYAVFGKVVEGMDVVDKIKATPTTTQGQYSDVPVKAVLIESAKAL